MIDRNFPEIIETKNHGTTWVKRDPKNHLVPTPLPEIGGHPIDQISKSSIQPVLSVEGELKACVGQSSSHRTGCV